jgi:hypothetical protein
LSSDQTDSRQGDGFYPRDLAETLLVDLFGRDQQDYLRTLLNQLFRYGKTREEVTARPATGNGNPGN